MQSRGRQVLGRNNEIQCVINYATTGKCQIPESISAQENSSCQGDVANSENVYPLVVTGASGMGKSALMSACVLTLQKVCSFFLYCYCGTELRWLRLIGYF